MCDILRRLNSPILTTSQYLSNLNDFSRICRGKREEELFLIQDDINGHDRMSADEPVNDNVNPIFLLNRNVERDNFTMDDVFTCLKTALFNEATEVRAAALRAIRYLLKDELTAKSLLRINLPIFIVRSIDIVLENRTERIQALRLVRKFLSISPKLFPSAFTRSLVAIAQDGLDEHDTLTRACWALLAELSIMCPKSSTRDTQNNAFNAIMDATLSGNQPHGMCESLISTLLYMLNWPSYRNLIRGEPDLQIFVAPFTDSHYTAPVLKQKQGVNQSAKFDVDPYDQREHKFNAAKITLISILRSWPGLIYLCEPQKIETNLVTKSCLKSLVNMLYLPYNDVRRRLIDLLFELLYLPLPESSADFDSGLKILEKHLLSKDSWKIHDAFIVDEARALLSPLRSRIRMNLVNDYMALLLLALFQCNVVDALSEVIITPLSQENSIRATILLYQLLSLSYQYLPTDSFSQYLTLSTLIAHATSKTDDSRDLANAALINLGRIRPLNGQSLYPNTRYSLFLAQLLEFCSPHLLDPTPCSGHDNNSKINNNSHSSTNTNNYNDDHHGNNLVHNNMQFENSSSTCNSISNTSTMNSLSTVSCHNSNLSSQRSNSDSSSTSTLVNLKGRHSRSPSISSKSPSILSKASTISTATSLFTLFSFPPASKSLKTMNEQNWRSWDWEYINFILTRPCDSLKKLSSHHYKTFIKRLVHFYKPSSNQYSLIDINNECSRKLCDTGCKMIDFLVESTEVKATELLREFLHDISISMHDPENYSSNNNNNINSNNLHNNNNINSNNDNHINSINYLGNFTTTSTRTTRTTIRSDNNTNNNLKPQLRPSSNNKLHQSANSNHQHQTIFTPNHQTVTYAPLSNMAHNEQQQVNILSSTKLISTLSSTYFLFIGRLSSSLRGYQLLEKTSIMSRIKDLTQTSMPSSSPAEVYVRLIISCFDYTKEYNGSRKLLEKFLFEHPEESVRLYATNFLRVLLRANVQDYSNWGVEFLVKQLYSPVRVIHFAAADILDEACDLNCHLEGVIGLNDFIDPRCKDKKLSVLDVLRSSKDIGVLLLSRYVSSPNGLRYLIEKPRQCLSSPLDTMILRRIEKNDDVARKSENNNNSRSNGTSTLSSSTTTPNQKASRTTTSIRTSSSYKADVDLDQPNIVIRNSPTLSMNMESEFDVELARWQSHFNYRYVKIVEDVLNDSLTYHQKGDDGKYGRRIDRINPMTKNSYLPPHLYGQLAYHIEGIEIIIQHRLLEPVYQIIRQPPDDLNSSEVSLLKFKAALWIIGHIGSTELGYQALDNSREILRQITEIAKSALVLSLRGTAFYVIGLLGSTEVGAEELKEFGWIVQKNNRIALPICLDLILSKPKDDVNNGYEKNIVMDEDEIKTLTSREDLELHIRTLSKSKSASSARLTDTIEHPPSSSANNHQDGKESSQNQNQQHLFIPSTVSNGDDQNQGDQGMIPIIPSHHILTTKKKPEELLKYSEEELDSIRRDIMKHVTNLSGQLAYRTAENSLLEFKRKYGELFQYDVNLYSMVCHQLARCNFRLQARRFLQELFLDTVG